MIKRIFAFALAAVLCLTLFSHAAAEDFFTIDVDVLDMDRLNSDDYVARELSASTQGIRVRKYISNSSELAAPVRLTLTQMDSRTVMFDKDYGYQSGTFDSGVIYLPYVDDRTIPYLVTLYIGDYVYAMPFMHLQPRLMHNGACTYGVRLRDLDPSLGGDWLMGTMVDLSQLRSEGSRTVDLIASNSYVIGQATLSMSGSSLRVDLAFNAGAAVDLNQVSLYVITDCAAYLSGRHGQSYGVSEWIDVGSHSTALIYLPMQLSYDPSGLPTFTYSLNESELQRQLRLWQENVGGESTASAPAQEWSWDDSANDSGWSEGSGWDDGWQGGSGWSDGWSEGSGWDDGWESGDSGWANGGW